MSTLSATRAPSAALRVTLWIGQAFLAGMFVFAGTLKLSDPARFPAATALIVFIGFAELTGAVGLIVPALTRIKPVLTPIAAAAFALLTVLATGYHLSRGQPVGLPAGLAAVSLFVAWGRGFKAPIRPR